MLGAEGSALGRGQTCSPWQSGGSLEAIPATENQAALPQDAETIRRPLALRRGNPSFQVIPSEWMGLLGAPGYRGGDTSMPRQDSGEERMMGARQMAQGTFPRYTAGA